ncbi:hypothetical protein [Actinomycetospora sp.]|uniref:hypothetical protein n=1 Tax=Actinomycetospora sp. TaxID=1872135 RepID=UPI002F3F121E
MRMMRFAVVPTAVAMAVVLTGWALSHRSGGHAVAFLLGDRNTGDQGSEWSGFFKFVSSEALLATVGVLLFAVGLAHAWRRRRRATPPRPTRHDVGIAVLVLVVVLDDLFVLHHSVLPGVGVPAIVGTVCYLLVLALLVACARRPMHDAGVQLAFRVAIACLAVAAVVVAVASHLEGVRDPAGVLANTGGVVKYLGYAALCWVLVVRARSIVGQVVRPPTAATPAVGSPGAGNGAALDDPLTEPFELPAGDLWEIRGELGQLGRTITRAVAPAGLGIAVFLVGFAATHHAIEIALQDQDTATGASAWSGLFTFLGCGALVVSVGVLLGALDLAQAWYRRVGPGQERRVLHAGVGVAILVLLIAFDDIFMIHDSILPSFHIPEVVGNGFYVVVGGAVVLWVMVPVHRLGLLLSMLLGLVGLAISVGGDKLEDVFEVSDPTLSHLLGNAEDISKFLGYAALCYVLVVFARAVVNQIVRDLPASPTPTPARAPDVPDAVTAALSVGHPGAHRVS